MKKKILMSFFLVVFLVSLLLNFWVTWKNPNFAAKQSVIELDDGFSIGIIYGENDYIYIEDYTENYFGDRDTFWDSYSIKCSEQKLCDLSVGSSFWLGLFKNREVFCFKDDPNRWLLKCSVPENSDSVYFRSDLKLPTLETTRIDAVYITTGNFHYKEDEYVLKIDDETQLDEFVDAYKSEKLEKWLQLLVNNNDVEGSYNCIVSYKEYPFYQRVISFEANQGTVLCVQMKSKS